MPIDLSAVDTIVIIMMENRSFDHLLGYLSLPGRNRTDVDGLRADGDWQRRFMNYHNGIPYLPVNLQDPHSKLPGDPPHERADIAMQLGAPAASVTGATIYPMTGFVDSYSVLDPATGQAVVMGYYQGDQVSTSDFFAANYAICDRWFASLPASTQPNRLMAMSGFTKIDHDNRIELPEQDLAYDWLSGRGIRWRVYHDGLPFFAMMPKWIPRIMENDQFRAYNRLRVDIKSEDAATFPQVIFIEPRYTDAPHVEAPTDDHAPSPISSGQQYLMRIYNDLTANPERWAKTVALITYDEHGGFFDHVSPPAVATKPPSGVTYPPFASLGLRVPGFVISPLVSAGTVYHGNLDHLSILKFLGEKFGGGNYSPEVDGRPVDSVSAVLNLPVPREDIPYPDEAQVGFSTAAAMIEPTPSAFAKALGQIRAQHPIEARVRFPELVHAFGGPGAV